MAALDQYTVTPQNSITFSAYTIMPVLRPSGSDFTSFVKAAAQYVPAGRGGKPSKSGGVPVSLLGLGAVVRTSQVGALASPTTSAVVINGVTPPAGGGGAPPLPFVPTSVTGCKMWFDTFDASYTLSGTTVTSWTNKSGNADATPQGSNPSIVNQAYLNGKSSIRFAADRALRLTVPISYSTIYRNIFVVATLSGNYARFIEIDNNVCGQFYVYDGAIQISKPGVVGLGTANGTVGYETILVSLCMSSGGNTGIFVNGTSKTLTVNIPAAGFLSAGPGGQPALPQIGNAGPYSQQHDTYEMLQYDGEITATQRQKIEGYLAWKWGLQSTLPAGHPFKTAAPTA